MLAAEIVGPTGSVTTIDVDSVLLQAAREQSRIWPSIRMLHDDGLTRADQVWAHNLVYGTFAVEQVPAVLLDALAEGVMLIAPVRPRLGNGFSVQTARRLIAGLPPNPAELD